MCVSVQETEAARGKGIKKCQERSKLCLPDLADVPAPDSSPDSASVPELQMLHPRTGPTLELGEGDSPGLGAVLVWRVELSPSVLKVDNNLVLFHGDDLILATIWVVAGEATQALPTPSMAHFG